jgi:hypothetical protein
MIRIVTGTRNVIPKMRIKDGTTKKRTKIVKRMITTKRRDTRIDSIVVVVRRTMINVIAVAKDIVMTVIPKVVMMKMTAETRRDVAAARNVQKVGTTKNPRLANAARKRASTKRVDDGRRHHLQKNPVVVAAVTPPRPKTMPNRWS